MNSHIQDVIMSYNDPLLTTPPHNVQDIKRILTFLIMHYKEQHKEGIAATYNRLKNDMKEYTQTHTEELEQAILLLDQENIPTKPSLQPHRHFYEQLLDIVKNLSHRLSQLFTLLKHYITGKPLLVPSTPPQDILPYHEYAYCKKRVVTYLTHSYPTHTHPTEFDNSQEQSQDTPDDNAHDPHIPPNGLGPK